MWYTGGEAACVVVEMNDGGIILKKNILSVLNEKKSSGYMRKSVIIMCISMVLSSVNISGVASAKLDKAEKDILHNDDINALDTSEYTLDNMSEVVKNVVYSSDKEPYCLVDNDMDTANSVTVKNNDGSLTTHIFPFDVKENDGKKVRFIGENIKAKKTKGYDYIDNSGNIKRRFSKNVNKGVEIECNKFKVELSPAGVLKQTECLDMEDDYKLKKESDGIVYENIFSDNIDVEYTSEANGIKENIVLEKYEGIHEFCFDIDTNGLIPDRMVTDCGSIQLINPETNICEMLINPVYAYDSGDSAGDGEKHVTIKNSMSLKHIDGSRYQLVIDVDKSFLSSKDTVYPVTIDPAITVPANNMDNTMIFEDNPNGRISWSTIMFVGKHNVEDYGMTEMYIRLKDISSYKYISPDKIDKVSFNIYEWSGHSYPAKINLYGLRSSTWEKDGISWNNKPATTGGVVSYVNYPPSDCWSEFNITGLFKSWLRYELKEGYSTTSKDNGFCLKAAAGNEHSRYYYSVNDSEKPPTITINYREDTSVSNDIYYLRNSESVGEESEGGITRKIYKYLDANVDKKEAILYPFKGQYNQEWKIEKDPKTGFYKLHNMWFYGFQNLALDTDTVNDGSKADFWSSESTGDWIKYRLIYNNDGTYRIMPVYGKKSRALTFVNNNEEYSSECIFTEYKGLKTQKWILEKAPNYNMKQRTIDVNVIIEKTYRQAQGENYLSILKNDFAATERAFDHVFNIKFNEIYKNDYSYFKNSECTVEEIEDGCSREKCGNDCTKHHRGWAQGCDVLYKHYTPSNDPREFTVGIFGTGLCFDIDGEHMSNGGLTIVGGQYSILAKPKVTHMDFKSRLRLQQHEFTHFFNIDDGPPCTANQRCIMNGGFEYSSFDDLHNIWCNNCRDSMHDFIENTWD